MDKTEATANEPGDEEVKLTQSKLSSIERALARTTTLETKLEDLIATLHVKGVRLL